MGENLRDDLAIPLPETRIRYYREQAALARRNAESATGADEQAFRMEAAQWDRAASRLEHSMKKSSGSAG